MRGITIFNHDELSINMTAVTVDFLGLVAGACTTFAFIPQVLRVWKTRSAADISYGMYFIYLTGNGLWFAYAFYTSSFPLMITNVVTIILSGSVVFLKVRLERPGGIELEQQSLSSK
jgi:MtN3 and saliva related transmembrane protein